jgi:hypothetical protein
MAEIEVKIDNKLRELQRIADVALQFKHNELPREYLRKNILGKCCADIAGGRK